MSAFSPRRAGRASRVRVLDLVPGVPVRIVCREGARVVAIDGALTLEYLEFDGAWLGGPLPLRRLRLAEGDSHPLPWAGAVTLRADGGGRCLVEQPLPWWLRLFGGGQAAVQPADPVAAVWQADAVPGDRAGQAVYLAAPRPGLRRPPGKRAA